jgi:hypothetical protein
MLQLVRVVALTLCVCSWVGVSHARQRLTSSGKSEPPSFPRLPFTAKRVVELVAPKTTSPKETLPVFGFSSHVRLNNGHYITSYDDTQSDTTYLAISTNEGDSWQTVTEIPNVTGLSLFTKGRRHGFALFGMGQQRRVEVDGKGEVVVLIEFYVDRYYAAYNDPTTKGELVSLEYKTTILSDEYQFSLSNTRVFHDKELGRILKQVDLVPSNFHENHRARILKLRGTTEGNKGKIVVECWLLDTPNEHSKVPLGIAARFSVGMKVQIGFARMEGYITLVRPEKNELHIDLESHTFVSEDWVDLDLATAFSYAGFEERIVHVVNDPNTPRWHSLLWAPYDSDFMNASNWRMSNVISGYSNLHANLFDTALKVGIPPSDYSRKEKLNAQPADGIIMRRVDGSLSIFMSVDNSRISDLALEIPLQSYSSKYSSSLYWLTTPKYSILPTFGRSHPYIFQDPATKGYFLIGNSGGSLPQFPNPRSALSIFFSRNLDEWISLGVVDFGPQPWFHLSNPTASVHKDELLFTVTTTTQAMGEENGYGQNKANAVFMYTVPRFRDALEKRWLKYRWG